MSEAKKQTKINTLSLVLIPLFSVLIAVCSQISIPLVVPFTLQTFGIFTALGLLGGKKGTVSIIIYMLLGAIGVPVFSGFKGGLAALMGPTGGYILGFLFTGLAYWLITSLIKNKTVGTILGMVVSLIVCYAFGTAWFMFVYTKNTGSITLLSALSMCVFPFLLPDGLKIALAILLSQTLSRYLPKIKE